MREFVSEVRKAVDRYLPGFDEQELARMVEMPQRGQADIAIPTFSVAKDWCMQPSEVAQMFAESGEFDFPFVERTEVNGGYLNLHLKGSELLRVSAQRAISDQNDYGQGNAGDGKTVVIDFSAPNTGKPMHIGHIRSTILGDAVGNIMRFDGYRVHGINYLGDTGLHMGKLLVAIDEWGDMDEIERDPEQNMLQLYTKFSGLESDAQEAPVDSVDGPLGDEVVQAENPWTARAKAALEKLESGDPRYREMVRKIYQWSTDAFDRVYDLLGTVFEETTGQSNFSQKGIELARKALEMGVAEKDETGAIIARLSTHSDLPDKVILRADGTPIYSTQDIGAAVSRFEDHKFDRMIYVVGNEQEVYFQQLFEMLRRMGYDWHDNCYHMSFGMLRLPEGKMSTRKGRVLMLEDFLNTAIERAREIVDEKSPEIEDPDGTARMIGIGAVKYAFMSVDHRKNMIFDLERALDFRTASGPSAQYAHARARRVLRKADYGGGQMTPDDINTPQSQELLRQIARFPLVVDSASRSTQPHTVAGYISKLGAAFNAFYQDRRGKIIGSPEETTRLGLTYAFAVTMNNALGLLGIDSPYEM